MTNTLRMPSSYVLMDNEEMMYVDGGDQMADRRFAQARLRAELAKLTPAQRAAAYRKAYQYQAGYISLALSGLSFLGPAIPAALAKVAGYSSFAIAFATLMDACR